MNESRLRKILAVAMLYGTVLAAAVMFVGAILYLVAHPGARLEVHLFEGEPARYRNPVDIVQAAFHGHFGSLIQIGVVLLLLNPLIRVALAVVGCLASRDFLYTAISGFVLLVLLVSYFV